MNVGMFNDCASSIVGRALLGVLGCQVIVRDHGCPTNFIRGSPEQPSDDFADDDLVDDRSLRFARWFFDAQACASGQSKQRSSDQGGYS